MRKLSEKPKRKPGRPATGKTPQRIFRISDEDYAKIQAAASGDEVSVSEWVRSRLLRGL